jgi:hypothetical protein
VRNEEVLLRVKVQRNILHEISKRKANWIGHILRSTEYKYLSCTLVLCHVWTSVVRREIPNLKTWDHFHPV